MLRVMLSLLLAVSYITTFSSCTTTYRYFEFPESMGQVTVSEITKIELKDGTMIDCKEKMIKFETGADSASYIVLESDTVGKDYQTYRSEKRIAEKDIYKIYMERSEINGTKTAIFVTGIVIVTALLAFIIGFATSKHSLNLRLGG
ncbi:MAG: hypothetical protein IPL53_15955 [Ignavibacteria bacterium]|nr:hypothetical protein [Ignavibacteria bacterium]